MEDTNNVWELAAAYGYHNNFPIVIRFRYGRGHVGIITIPDDMSQVYQYPNQVLRVMRELPYDESIRIKPAEGYTGVKDLISNGQLKAVEGSVPLRMTPGVNYILKLQK